MHLTDISIRQIAFTENGQRRVWDDQTPGFGLVVGKRTKTFIVMFGRERTLKTLGRYPSVSLKDARSAAKRLLAAPTSSKASLTLLKAREAYLSECETKNRDRTVAEYRRYLRILDGKTFATATRQALRTDSPHALVALKVFFNWCVRNEYADRNPLSGERATYGHARSRVLTHDELKAVWAYEAPPFSDIVKLLILMGQRRSETAAIEDAWITDDLITFPPEITKNKREHVLPFGETAGAYLPPEPFNGWSKAKARIDKHVKIAPWMLHDLRRTFSTIHAEIGTPVHVTERLLNHVSGTISGVAAIYNRHSYVAEMRQAVRTYEAHIAILCGR